MYNKIFVVCLFVCFMTPTQSIENCGDWTAYKDIKCFRILTDKRITEEDAVKNCTKLDTSSTLASIHSQEEEDFLKNLLTQNKVSNNVWIGLKYSGSEWEWLDGQNSSYRNWSSDAIKDGSLPCVQMSPSTGEWSDESCKKIALTVCQKKQEFDTNVLKDVIKNIDQKLKQLETRIEKELSVIKSSPIPIGFIYIQLPNQSEPRGLWPNTIWRNVNTDYAGLFFRAGGGDAKDFGQIQQSKQSTISQMETLSGHFDSWKVANWSTVKTNIIEQGKWSDELVPEKGFALFSMKIFTSSDEARPRNTAVNIWKRIS